MSCSLYIIIPKLTIVFKVLDLSIPTPFLSNHLTGDHVAIYGRFVPFIPPDSACGPCLGHVYGKAIQLAKLETIASEEVIFGCVRSIFELALFAYINSVWNNVLRPDIGVAIISSEILVTKGGDMIRDNRRTINFDTVIDVTIIPRHSEDNVVRML